MGKIYDLMYRGLFFFWRVLVIREIRVSTVIIVKETIFLSVPFSFGIYINYSGS